jgi:hypothetical protein
MKLRGLKRTRVAHHMRYSDSVQGIYADNFRHSKKKNEEIMEEE